MEAGKYLRATLIYHKVFRPVSDPQKTPSQNQTKAESQKTSSTPIPTSNDTKSSTTLDMENPKAKMISGLFDEYFKKNAHMSRQEKKNFLLGLKTSFEAASKTVSPKDTKNIEMYGIILMVLENYPI